MAASIHGNLNMYGDFQPLQPDGSAAADLSTATQIEFLPANGSTGSFGTGMANNDLSTFAFQSGGVIKDFSFNPFSGPIGTFYTITVGGETLSFDLLSVSVAFQNADYINLAGTGTLHLTGFENTPGVWNFSGQISGDDSNATFSWSAGSSSTVPEPTTLALAGFGLLATGFVRRRRT